MLKFLYRKIKTNEFKKLNNINEAVDKAEYEPKINKSLSDNINVLKKIFESASDVVFREFVLGGKGGINCVIVFLQGLTERRMINEVIIGPLINEDISSKLAELRKGNMDIIQKNIIPADNINKIQTILQIVDECLSGNTIFLMEGSEEALSINTKGCEKRAIEEPKSEAVVRGPRVGFSENINTNMSLLRQKIRNPNLKFETVCIGKQTMTRVCIVYIKNIVNPKLVTEMKKRLNRINTGSVLESGYIEEFIEDAPMSIFPTVGNTERPDSTAAKILEGRIGILVDGSPFALTVPMLFIEGFQSVEDYYSRPFYASLIRSLRFVCFILSIFTPATYVMLATFHQELIPTTLLLTMAAGREGVPFPAVLEAGLMVVTFEILREAGVRLPRPVGQAVSIVGALVIGEAAVSAGLVGGLLVIVVALTAVSSFVVPTYTDVVAILRAVFLILAGAMGIFGIGMGIMVVAIHMVSLRSFGAPYVSPIAPLDVQGLKDSFIRSHLWKMKNRPKDITHENITREGDGLKPRTPKRNNIES
ncbi:spore germination protein [Clostridium oryzae]|uniref:Spore germination protein B1 n=1 Tax=Clostridium oryzae TaxID=1450648 RepID=A0A1V4IDV4_9CLOT|nr:spore germination protein [Clostridium oryzae]OPJ58099.1 spore germination protein B1 [Clostridium oryzae]